MKTLSIPVNRKMADDIDGFVSRLETAKNKELRAICRYYAIAISKKYVPSDVLKDAIKQVVLDKSADGIVIPYEVARVEHRVDSTNKLGALIYMNSWADHLSCLCSIFGIPEQKRIITEIHANMIRNVLGPCDVRKVMDILNYEWLNMFASGRIFPDVDEFIDRMRTTNLFPTGWFISSTIANYDELRTAVNELRSGLRNKKDLNIYAIKYVVREEYLLGISRPVYVRSPEIIPKIVSGVRADEYVYIVHEREFVRSDEQTFKIGKTKQHGLRRFNGYPKDSELKLFVCCRDCDTLESAIIKLFDRKYKKRTDYGSEYYEGDIDAMIADVMSLRGNHI
jgi:hypothetical protein